MRSSITSSWVRSLGVYLASAIVALTSAPSSALVLAHPQPSAVHATGPETRIGGLSTRAAARYRLIEPASQRLHCGICAPAVGLASGDSIYANANPLTNTDPTGLMSNAIRDQLVGYESQLQRETIEAAGKYGVQSPQAVRLSAELRDVRKQIGVQEYEKDKEDNIIVPGVMGVETALLAGITGPAVAAEEFGFAPLAGLSKVAYIGTQGVALDAVDQVVRPGNGGRAEFSFGEAAGAAVFAPLLSEAPGVFNRAAARSDSAFVKALATPITGESIAGYLKPLMSAFEDRQLEVDLGSGGRCLVSYCGPGFLGMDFDRLVEGVRHDDFNGPWRELRDIKWGEYLRKGTGTEPPTWMKRAHAHHAVFKRGRLGPERDLLLEAQDIVRRRAGVDPFYGFEGLGWAPNKGHSTAVAEDIVARLKALDAANGTPEQFHELLGQFLDEAAQR